MKGIAMMPGAGEPDSRREDGMSETMSQVDIFRATALKAEEDARVMQGFPGSEYPARVARIGLRAIDELESELARARANVEVLERDARRYQWLRAGNAYAPEENMVRGDDELDRLCDDAISSLAGRATDE